MHFADPEIDPPLGYFDGPLGGYLISESGDVASMVTMHGRFKIVLSGSPSDDQQLYGFAPS